MCTALCVLFAAVLSHDFLFLLFYVLLLLLLFNDMFFFVCLYLEGFIHYHLCLVCIRVGFVFLCMCMCVVFGCCGFVFLHLCHQLIGILVNILD